MDAPANSIFPGPVTLVLSMPCGFDGDPFTSQCEKEKNKKAFEFQEFQITHFQGSLSDDILAVKGLRHRAPNPAQYAADWFLVVSCFGNAYDFVFVFVAVCFFFVVCTCILCLLPCHIRWSFTYVLSCTPAGVSEINHLT